MKHLEYIKIIGKTFPGSTVLKKNFKITCSDVNLFVGNQGCGKSTLLTMLQQNHSDLEVKIADSSKGLGVKSYYFDTERDNPRIKNPDFYTDPREVSVGYGYGNALMSRLRSHGEVIEELILYPLLKAKDCVILLDEPESGLSVTNQFKLIDAINGSVKNGCQLFIATHCYPLIERMPNVVSLEHKKQMSGGEFLDLIKNQ